MAERRLKLGDILIQGGLITKDQLEQALNTQKKSHGKNIGSILIQMGIVTEKQIALTLSKQLNLPFVSREEGLLPAPDQNLIKLVPEEFARKHTIVPLAMEASFLKIAMA